MLVKVVVDRLNRQDDDRDEVHRTAQSLATEPVTGTAPLGLGTLSHKRRHNKSRVNEPIRSEPRDRSLRR